MTLSWTAGYAPFFRLHLAHDLPWAYCAGSAGDELVRFSQLRWDGIYALCHLGRFQQEHYAISEDSGKTWGPVKSFGFKVHCPYFLRHSSGVILLAHRVPATSLHWTSDEGKTWNGPVRIDTVGGAYPSMVELPDALVFCVYYEEGKGSSIRGVRLRVDKDVVTVVGKKD